MAKKYKFGNKVQQYTNGTIYQKYGITHSGLILIALHEGHYNKVSLCIRHQTSADVIVVQYGFQGCGPELAFHQAQNGLGDALMDENQSF